MSASADDNAAAVAGHGGEFSSHIPATGPQTTTGHQPGRLVSEADHAPEFHATTLPAGTAPPESTFKPNPTGDENPGQGLDTPAATQTEAGATTSASDTLGGSTSQDVATGLGHPGSGQSSASLRDNSGGGGGLQGVGAGQAPSAGESGADRLDLTSPVPGASQKKTGQEFTPGKSDMSGQ